MHLFSHVGALNGGPVETLGVGGGHHRPVNEAMDVEVSLWQGQFGYPLGTVAWTALLESRAQLADETAKLAGDKGYLDLLTQGQAFVGTVPFEDAFRTMVHATTEPGDPPPPGAWAEVTTASPAAGQLGAALAWGVEMADRYTAITGTGSAFFTDDYGPFGQMTWIAVHQDAAAADRAAEGVAGDADYLAALDAGGDLFQPGSASQAVSVQLGLTGSAVRRRRFSFRGGPPPPIGNRGDHRCPDAG